MTRLTAKDAWATWPKQASKMGNKPVWECQSCGFVTDQTTEAYNLASKIHTDCTYKKWMRFASKREFNRWKELQRLEKAGQIRNLRRQVDFTFVVNGRQIKTPKGSPLKYRCDATGEEMVAPGVSISIWQPFVHDAKGQRSGVAYDLFWLKRELMAAGACPEFPEGILVRET